MEIVIKGDPRTKKNSPRIITKPYPKVLPSKQFEQYQEFALWQLKGQKPDFPIAHPVNVKCTYYMKSYRKVDLVNLQEATLDILVKAGVLADDNSSIVVSMDGSCVKYDKQFPRVEIEIKGAAQ